MYSLVGENGYINLSDEEFKSKVMGSFVSPRCRAELQGQPILDGFCGPMWDGYRYITPEKLKYEFEATEEEKETCTKIGVIRYETQEAYDMFSR